MQKTNNKNESSVMRSIRDAFTPQREINKKTYTIIGVISFVLLIAIWQGITVTGLVNSTFMPTPLKTIKAGYDLFAKNDYISDIWITVWRVLLGFIISVVIAVPIGILIGTYTPIEAFIEPIMSFLRYLPVTAFIPLFILWIGIDESEKIAVIIFGSLPQLILMVAVDTRKVSNDLVEVAYTLGTSRAEVIWKVIFPSALPSIIDSLRMVLGWSWTYVTVAEMIGASSGMGYMIIQSQRMINVGNIFVGILVIGIIGLIFDYCFKGLSRLLFPWK